MNNCQMFDERLFNYSMQVTNIIITKKWQSIPRITSIETLAS